MNDWDFVCTNDADEVLNDKLYRNEKCQENLTSSGIYNM